MDLSSTVVVFEDVRKVGLREIRLPEPGDEDIVIDNVYTGISVGTEGWILRGERPVDSIFPCVPGYQQTGIVAWAGGKVEGIAVGDRVNAQSTRLPEGINSGWGGHASRSVTSFRGAVKIPEGVSMKAASLSKLFAVGFRGVRQSEIRQGEVVVVVGLGMIGQGFAQIARSRGAYVIGADLAPNRLELARLHSCDEAVLGPELADAVRDKRPQGADVVAETTGRAEIVDSLIPLVREEGRFVWQGWYPGRVSFEFHPAHGRRVYMVFPCYMEGEDQVLAMVAAKRLTIEPLVTHVFEAERAPEAYALMLGKASEFLGVALQWRAE